MTTSALSLAQTGHVRTANTSSQNATGLDLAAQKVAVALLRWSEARTARRAVSHERMALLLENAAVHARHEAAHAAAAFNPRR